MGYASRRCWRSGGPWRVPCPDLVDFLEQGAEKLASNFLEASLLSPVKHIDYSSDVVPFGHIAAAASTLIKEVVLRVAVPWSKVEAKRIKASPLTEYFILH